MATYYSSPGNERDSQAMYPADSGNSSYPVPSAIGNMLYPGNGSSGPYTEFSGIIQHQQNFMELPGHPTAISQDSSSREPNMVASYTDQRSFGPAKDMRNEMLMHLMDGAHNAGADLIHNDTHSSAQIEFGLLNNHNSMSVAPAPGQGLSLSLNTHILAPSYPYWSAKTELLTPHSYHGDDNRMKNMQSEASQAIRNSNSMSQTYQPSQLGESKANIGMMSLGGAPAGFHNEGNQDDSFMNLMLKDQRPGEAEGSLLHDAVAHHSDENARFMAYHLSGLGRYGNGNVSLTLGLQHPDNRLSVQNTHQPGFAGAGEEIYNSTASLGVAAASSSDYESTNQIDQRQRPCRCRSSCRIEAAVWLPQAQGLGSCIFFCTSKCALLLSCGPGNYGFSVCSMTPNPKAFNNHHLSIIEEPAELAL
uniref:Uncharacterized protein n=1 Tax=Oryza barthii TaxID=65489 RepID=A0A0D3FMG3_9ORYZ